MLVTDTWTIDSSIGVSFAGLSVLGGTSWSKSAGVKASQEVTFSIPPGKMVCALPTFLNQNALLMFLCQAVLTANVSYKKTSGNMFIDST